MHSDIGHNTTWHIRMPAPTEALSYIDDRMITSSELLSLNDAWRIACEWDKSQGRLTNPDKSCDFGSSPAPCLGFVPPLPDAVSFSYQGYDIRTRATAVRAVLLKRWQKAKDTAHRISQLPAKVSVSLRSALVTSVLTPQWHYGLLTSPPTKEMMLYLEGAYRRAMWFRAKRMHSWKAALALIYKPWSHSAWGAMIYRQLQSFTRALRQTHSDRLRTLWNSPPPIRITGPVQTTIHFCRQISLVPLPDFRIQDSEGAIWNIADPNPKFWRVVQQHLRTTLLRQAQQERRHLRTDAQVNLTVTQKLQRKSDFAMISELVCLVSDGLWTAPHLSHAGRAPHRGCWWCTCLEQTPGHLFWECPYWANSCPRLPNQHLDLVREHHASLHCGHCLTHFPLALQKNWERLQTFMCQISEPVTSGMRLRCVLRPPLLSSLLAVGTLGPSFFPLWGALPSPDPSLWLAGVIASCNGTVFCGSWPP